MNKIKQIIRECLNENNSYDFNNMDVDKIILYIKSLPNKYRLKTRYGDVFKPYENGIDTALNNGMITHFYLKYLKNNNKTTKILPTPNLNPAPYEKLNDLIKQCDFYNEHYSLFRATCFQLINILLYEDYFNIDFRYGNGHKIIENLVLPKNKKEFYMLSDEFTDKNGEIKHVIFFADVNPIVSMIERYE